MFSVTECVEELDEFVIDPTEAMLRKLKKIERCLRVLENVSGRMCWSGKAVYVYFCNGGLL